MKEEIYWVNIKRAAFKGGRDTVKRMKAYARATER